MSIRDAAEMAARSYNEYDLSPAGLENRKLGNGWRLIDIYKGSEGLVIHIYVRGDGEHSAYTGPKEYAVVNKGTSSNGDWINNLQQPFGMSTDMNESIDYVKNFVNNEKRRNCKITFVGHSKGGAEAVANAIATNKNAIVFNPAELSVANYRPEGLYTGDISAYVVSGEPLNVWNSFFAKYGLPYKTKFLPFYSLNPIKNHSIEAVINGINKQESENQEDPSKMIFE